MQIQATPIWSVSKIFKVHFFNPIHQTSFFDGRQSSADLPTVQGPPGNRQIRPIGGGMRPGEVRGIYKEQLTVPILPTCQQLRVPRGWSDRQNWPIGRGGRGLGLSVQGLQRLPRWAESAKAANWQGYELGQERAIGSADWQGRYMGWVMGLYYVAMVIH